eukprot:gnl/TRDRNA2_/TRDRNA2_204180_c0_seq1.p1 gnl/TRDRNA2_/TRDRNA2_204180_c0~~gnl/TRDRNA2_/TRDRNA2_204180_c0_seq1.p1  ORF type:complete len:403 (+),score=25.08 gnl/TRDRNA2_/TRDRNA2_204180_c0_seq1:76-1284(+)
MNNQLPLLHLSLLLCLMSGTQALPLSKESSSVNEPTGHFHTREPPSIEDMSRFSDILPVSFMQAPELEEPLKKVLEKVSAVVNDPDCMLREFDMKTASLSEMGRVMDKCKMVVVRNAIDPAALSTLYRETNEYGAQISGGCSTCSGVTSNGEGFILKNLQRDQKTKRMERYELLLPGRFLQPMENLTTPLRDMLKQNEHLGPNMNFHSIGVVVSQERSGYGHWHTDNSYIFEGSGPGWPTGHETPAYAITLLAPLVNTTGDSGMTEFCMGTSHLAGLSGRLNQTAVKAMNTSYNTCRKSRLPGRMRKVVLKVGDVAMFDYRLLHRGGANKEDHIRPVLYSSFSRPWFRDSNFRISTRTALPDTDEMKCTNPKFHDPSTGFQQVFACQVKGHAATPGFRKKYV